MEAFNFPDSSRRLESWSLLKSLGNQNSLPWVCVGDFNEIVSRSEKEGGSLRPEWQMRNFRDALADARLSSLPTLDTHPVNHGYIRKRFRFEAMWLHHDQSKEQIKQAWEGTVNGDSMARVKERIQACQRRLETWEKDCFGHVTRTIKVKSKQLEELEQLPLGNQVGDQVGMLKKKLNDLLGKEEIMWRQRSRVQWLREGDRNTKFFHARANHRKWRNGIGGITNQNGRWVTKQNDIAQVAVQYFQAIFSTSNPTEEDISMVLNQITPSVTEEMNQILSKDFIAAEVGEALAQMGPTKAPGPDGMPHLFFQSCWSQLGSNVTEAVLDCLNHGGSLQSINHTHLVLIPKRPSPTAITEYRPISLCNVLYKLVSKTLANHLKAILPALISDKQSAFVPGRQIVDNILVAFEAMHSLKTAQRRGPGQMALKLDMSKEYDRVEWNFLEGMMRRMGFVDSWVKLVMHCISSVSYSVVVNGVPNGMIYPSRGLRQGDPLSPYLFLLCGEGLSALLHKAEEASDLHGVACSRRGPRISHLLFADDSLLFCEATMRECAVLMELLRRNTAENLRVAIQHVIGVPEEKVWIRIHGWKEKLLSQAGREILIKTVAQSMPTYTMNCFLLPKRICSELQSIVRQFWWGQKGGERKINWLAWKKMCRSKFQGGMGFRDLEAFNLTLLAKQGWWLIHDLTSLFTAVFKAKYFPTGSFLQAKVRPGYSYAWRSIAAARPVLEAGSKWRIGDGRNISIRNDKWIPDGKFTVKSAYHVAFSRIADHTAAGSFNDSDMFQFWKALWKVWATTSEWGSNLYSALGSNNLDWIWGIWKFEGEVVFTRVAVVLWSIWNVHNSAVFKDSVKIPSKVTRESVRWSAPVEGWYKVTMDGAVFADIQKVGIGVVIKALSSDEYDLSRIGHLFAIARSKFSLLSGHSVVHVHREVEDSQRLCPKGWEREKVASVLDFYVGERSGWVSDAFFFLQAKWVWVY
uniref:Reverse transcriptase domain-containing protein n=1 Tax=Fagus sylvatica TaxID=28930 RepID=A0A2N9HAL6_FAGSY